MADVVNDDEIASGDESEFQYELIVRVGKLRSQSKVDRMVPARPAQHVHDVID